MLGRDVVVALTTEDTGLGVDVTAAGAVDTFAVANGSTDTVFAGAKAYKNLADSPISGIADRKTVFGTQGETVSNNYTNEVSDLTGVDIGIGVTDEDVSTFGTRTAGKVEVKKETTLSLTRKKKDNSWDLVFNNARHGVESASAFFGYGSVGHVNPGRADYGYRVFLKLVPTSGSQSATGGEVMTLPNCCITGHTVSLNVDGTAEETLELMCYVEPIVTDGSWSNVDGTDPIGNTTVF